MFTRRPLMGWVGFPKQRFKFPVTFLFKIFGGDKLNRGGLNAVAKPGGFGAIFKNVAQVGIAVFRAYFRAFHKKFLVFMLNYVFSGKRARKRRPAGFGIKF